MYSFGPAHHPFLFHCPRPTSPCAWCDEPFTEADSGFVMPVIPDGFMAYHDACLMRSFVGSVAHQLKLCPCFSGIADEDAPGLTKRQAAQAAMELFQTMRRTEGKAHG